MEKNGIKKNKLPVAGIIVGVIGLLMLIAAIFGNAVVTIGLGPLGGFSGQITAIVFSAVVLIVGASLVVAHFVKKKD